MQSVLGLSMTSTSVGWVLLDGQGPDAAILDNDAFDIPSGVNGVEGATSPHTAAARGAQAIAAASGHKVGSVHVTWTEDVEADGAALLKSLADLGFDNVHPIPLTTASRGWGVEVGRESDHAKTGLCILEPGAATIMIIATGTGSVRTAVTDSRESAEDIVEWLRTVFRKDGWLPESLYLIGPHADLDTITQPVADALPIPVSDSVDTQLALARGAALSAIDQADGDATETVEAPPEKTWRVPRPKKAVAAAAAEPTVVAPVNTIDATLATQVIEKSRDITPAAAPRRERPWVVAHAKKLTIGAAAVAVFGAALSLAAGSALNVENASTQAADTAAEGASVTSVSIHTVPAPLPSLPAPQLQPLAAEPPPAPPAPPVEQLPPRAEPLASVAPEPVAVPVAAPTVAATPHVEVPAPSPVAASPVVTPPAAAPLAAPVAPPPAAPVVVEPPAAPPAAVPPPAPAPIAPPPAPVEAADPPPPPDPIQQVLSPLFSGLP